MESSPCEVGLWDYDDDIPPPCDPSKDESDEVVIIDSQEEAGRRRGRKPCGGCTVAEAKKKQGRPNKRKRVEMLAIIDDDDEDRLDSLDKQKQQAREQQKVTGSHAHPGSHIGTQNQSAPPTTKPPAPPQLYVSSQTKALLEQSKLVQLQLQGAEEEEEEEEEEDQASPLKGSSDWQQQRSTAQHDSGESAGTGVMHMPQFAALSARARAAEALQREQQEQEEQRLRKQQQQQQQDEEQLQGVQGATQEPSAGAAEEGSKIEIKCQYKAGDFFHLRSLPSKKVCEILHAFKDVLCKKGKGELLPQDDSAFRLEFDGDRLNLETTLEEAGIEDGDSLDFMWK
mmetsp:Transcript_1426/g.3444  ORF Transcript_1426/g.3444 Transcript_1426/m.3444 type:complete len:341 (+) Transcript_1426:94-1116(+)